MSSIWYFFNHLSHLFHANSLNFIKIFILFAIYMYTTRSPQLLISQTHTSSEHCTQLHQNEEGLMASLIPSQGYARGVLWLIRMLEPCLWAAVAILLAWPRTGCWTELASKLLALCTASSDRQVSTERKKNAVCRSIRSVRCKYSWSKFECLLCQRKAENFVTSGVYESVLSWHISNLW